MTNFTKWTRPVSRTMMRFAVFSALSCGIGYRADAEDGWQLLFNKKNLKNWQVVKQEPFVYHGKVQVTGGQVRLGEGQPGTGIRYLKDVPRTNYELLVEARREVGFDFFCGLTFPVGSNYCTFVAGGWDGDVTGLSNLDRRSAAENETTTSISYETGRWYRFHLRVTPERITVHMDEKKIVDAPLHGKEVGIRGTMQPLLPLGISSWYTQAGIRELRLRPLPEPKKASQK